MQQLARFWLTHRDTQTELFVPFSIGLSRFQYNIADTTVLLSVIAAAKCNRLTESWLNDWYDPVHWCTWGWNTCMKKIVVLRRSFFNRLPVGSPSHAALCEDERHYHHHQLIDQQWTDLSTQFDETRHRSPKSLVTSTDVASNVVSSLDVPLLLLPRQHWASCILKYISTLRLLLSLLVSENKLVTRHIL